MDYKYIPLENPSSETRVALLQPGTYDDELHISFNIGRLKEDELDYEALSYVWGSTDDPSRVLIDDNGTFSKPITRNLDIALRHLRSLQDTRIIWVDALCIDQESSAEKGKQVAFMGDIYSSASCVLIWLGPEEHQSNDAIALMKSLSKEIRVDWDKLQLLASSQCTSNAWADCTIPLPYEDGELSSVWAMFRRPYFRRAWVRQEVILARKATVCCGFRSIPWEDFRCITFCLDHKPIYNVALGADQRISLEPVEVVYNLCRMHLGRFRLCDPRNFQSSAECQDPRDRIYSVLNLFVDKDRLLDIKPDYDLTVERLFENVAQRLVEKQQSLEFLWICHQASNILHLPSWVPDWSVSSRISKGIVEAWSACGWISAQAYIKDSHLCANGVARGRIKSVTDLNMDTSVNQYEDTLRIIRQLKPAQNGRALKSSEWRDTLRDYCVAMVYGEYNHISSLPQRLRSKEEIVEALELVWSSDTEYSKLEGAYDLSPLRHLVGSCHENFLGRCFLSTGDGAIGLGPAGAQENDVICVLLGCLVPIALRPVHGAGTDMLWRVVGPVILPGLMRGEAIYGDKLPPHYRTMYKPAYNNPRSNPIDGYNFSLHNTVNDEPIEDPAAVLEEVGIKVEHYRRWPHELEVLPETLRAAGVALEEFEII